MTTQEKILVMQGFVDGKRIQVRYGESRWTDYRFSELDWNWEKCEYRIKPEEKPLFRAIPIVFGGGSLSADGFSLVLWYSQKKFVGFKYADGAIRPYPVMINRDNENNISGVDRATHVVVEEMGKDEGGGYA